MNSRYDTYAVCLRSRAVLLTQRWDGDANSGVWTLPGGGLEWGEPPADGVLRALHEQAGLRGRVTSILGVDTELHRPWRQRGPLHSIRFIYRVEADGQLRAIEGSGAVDVQWIPFDRLADLPLVPLVPTALDML